MINVGCQTEGCQADKDVALYASEMVASLKLPLKEKNKEQIRLSQIRKKLQTRHCFSRYQKLTTIGRQYFCQNCWKKERLAKDRISGEHYAELVRTGKIVEPKIRSVLTPTSSKKTNDAKK